MYIAKATAQQGAEREREKERERERERERESCKNKNAIEQIWNSVNIKTASLPIIIRLCV